MGNRWFTVLESVKKTEYQGRGTEHTHIAAWVLAHVVLRVLAGNKKTVKVMTGLLRYLFLVFGCEVDIQVGNGRLNYINGYIAKDHDTVDVGLGEYVQRGNTAPWLASYRLLSKSTPCIPEVALRMASASEFERTYSHVLLYPPQADECRSAEGRERNFSSRMYGIYLQEMRLAMAAGIPISQSFLVWHRTREYDKASRSCVLRGEKGGQRFGKTMVTACRYWYELTDGFWGQFVSTQIPHAKPEDILPTEKYLHTMINFFGMIDYVWSWTWAETPGTIRAKGGVVFELKALPLLLTEENEVWDLRQGEPGDSVFTSERAAFVYMMALAKRDLEYRGFSDDRVLSFQYKQEALYLLFGRVRRCTDDHEFEMYRQSWDTLVYAKYKPKEWHPKQKEALDRIRERTTIDDEEVKKTTRRFLYVKGRPGSGKTAVLIEGAVCAAKDGLTVLIVCPTGALVCSLKELLPEFDGVERIHVDTIHADLKYKRDRDNKVEFVPPSGFRKYEAVFLRRGVAV